MRHQTSDEGLRGRDREFPRLKTRAQPVLNLLSLTVDSGVSQRYNTTPKKNQLFGRDHQTGTFLRDLTNNLKSGRMLGKSFMF